jgi:metal-responsive CopG/Arc/MetJ family transcriptional regulator
MKTESLNVNVPEDLLEEFRKYATKKYGYKRGHIKHATIDALKEWINEEKLKEGD